MRKPIIVAIAVAAALVVAYLAGRVASNADRSSITLQRGSQPRHDVNNEEARVASPADDHIRGASAPTRPSSKGDSKTRLAPSGWSVPELVSEIRRTAGRKKRASLLHRLALIGSPEAVDGLLAIFQDESIPLERMGSTWADVFAQVDDPRLVQAVLAVLRTPVRSRKSYDLTPLWGFVIERSGDGVEEAVIAALSDVSVAPNSVLKTSVLKGIQGPISLRVRDEVVRYLDDPDAKLLAFQALTRSGDPDSMEAAYQFLLRNDRHGFVAARYFGPHLTVDRARAFQAASASDMRLTAAYLVAVSHASDDIVRSQVAIVRGRASELLRQLGESRLRKATAHAILRIASYLADSSLVDTLRAEAARTEYAREPLLRAALEMERVLAKNE